MCTADNGVGKAQNRKTHLNIEFSPKIKVPSPRIPQALYHEALLSCEIKASPSPVMYWKKNNKTIDNDANHQISHFALADEMTVTKLKVFFAVSWYTFVGDVIKFTFKIFSDLLKCHFNKYRFKSTPKTNSVFIHVLQIIDMAEMHKIWSCTRVNFQL